MHGRVEDERTWRTIVGLMLAIPVAFALSAAVERRRLPPFSEWIGTALLLAVHQASFDWQTTVAFALRTAELVLAAHLLVSFLPYVGAGRAAGVWSYDQSLFTRAVTAVVFSSILFAGLAVGLGTTRYLFGLDVTWQAFAHLAIGTAFAFNTWFFLAGVPEPLPDADVTEIPHALAVLTQRVLMPLVVLYLAILYAYVGKIVVTRVWPEGTVGYLVSAFAALGILTLLLADPLRDDPAHRWVRTFARAFYPALAPLVVLLLLAAWRRIDEYGVTERRYFLVSFGVWLGGMVAYFGVARGRDVRVVPISLCVGIMLTIAGPWGAYEVSRRSQLGRITRILTEKGLLVDGKLVFAPAPVARRTRIELSSMLDYLIETHGDALPSWVESDLTVLHRGSPAKTMAAMGLDYLGSYARRDPDHARDSFFWRANSDDQPVGVDGFEASLQVDALSSNSVKHATWKERAVEVALVDGSTLRVTVGDAVAATPLASLVGTIRAAGHLGRTDISAPELRVVLESPALRGVFLVSWISGTLRNDDVAVERIEGTLLFGRTDAAR